MKVILAIDSFKGSLPSSRLAAAAEKGILAVYPEAEVVKIPVADGGEGTVEALVAGTEGSYIDLAVLGPLDEPVMARYGISGDGSTAVIEMAEASGLPLIPPDKRNPEKTSTYGTGQLILDGIERGCRNFVIGIGGSATNDCGTGMMQALGMTFHDSSGKELKGCGENLPEIAAIGTDRLDPRLKECRFRIACDVDNPLYGERGAAYVYSPQKGADEAMVLRLDRGLEHFSRIVAEQFGFDMNRLPGAGAAGGLGGAFAAFLNGSLEPGIGLVLKETGIREKLEGADFVLTGEGRIDFQSVMGKTPVGVAKAAAERNVPVIAIAGSVADDAVSVHNHGISALFSIMNYPITLEEALEADRTAFLVERNAEEIFRLIKICQGRSL
ncbi:MAG: glycerate kinase [Spirochaetales bacterium]|nr:glycerate kinase [Spirochaetales bacterium]